MRSKAEHLRPSQKTARGAVVRPKTERPYVKFATQCRVISQRRNFNAHWILTIQIKF